MSSCVSAAFWWSGILSSSRFLADPLSRRACSRILQHDRARACEPRRRRPVPLKREEVWKRRREKANAVAPRHSAPPGIGGPAEGACPKDGPRFRADHDWNEPIVTGVLRQECFAAGGNGEPSGESSSNTTSSERRRPALALPHAVDRRGVPRKPGAHAGRLNTPAARCHLVSDFGRW